MKVSVIIPIYNVERYVASCIESVLQQTSTDYEIICINDASTDGSRDVVLDFMKEDDRIVLYDNEENLGLASTRNRGLELAKGDYVYFLDSDDMIEPDALEKLCAMADEESLDVCIFTARFIYENQTLNDRFKTDPATFKGDYPEVMSGQELFKSWMKVWDWMPSQPRYFYRREFLEQYKIRFIDGMLHEDETYAFDVLMNAGRVRVINEPYFIRRFRESSIMSGPVTMKNVESCHRIMEHVSEFKTDDNELRKAIWFYLYKIYMDAGRKLKALRDSSSDIVLPEKFKYIDSGGTEVYACSSYYQVLIAIIITMTRGISIDLILEEHGIETAAELAGRLIGKSVADRYHKKQGLISEYVKGVYICPTSIDVDPYHQKETAADEELTAKLIAHVDSILKGKNLATDYENVNVFWDLGYIGTYLNVKCISYTLHEDSLNSYKRIRETRPNYTYIFDEQKRREHRGVVPFGYSEYCSIVEVNEIDGTEVSHGKLRECSRTDMMNSLSPEERQAIYDTFVPENLTDEDISVLILTEPFFKTGRLPTEETQIKLYESIIREYGQDGNVLIKAHPRDDMNYAALFSKAFIIDKNIPMEVMNFNPDFHIRRAVTVTSSAIFGLECVDEKVFLDVNYLEDYR